MSILRTRCAAESNWISHRSGACLCLRTTGRKPLIRKSHFGRVLKTEHVAFWFPKIERMRSSYVGFRRHAWRLSDFPPASCAWYNPLL
jgi:hypothetical protein